MKNKQLIITGAAALIIVIVLAMATLGSSGDKSKPASNEGPAMIETATPEAPPAEEADMAVAEDEALEITEEASMQEVAEDPAAAEEEGSEPVLAPGAAPEESESVAEPAIEPETETSAEPQLSTPEQAAPDKPGKDITKAEAVKAATDYIRAAYNEGGELEVTESGSSEHNNMKSY